MKKISIAILIMCMMFSSVPVFANEVNDEIIIVNNDDSGYVTMTKHITKSELDSTIKQFQNSTLREVSPLSNNNIVLCDGASLQVEVIENMTRSLNSKSNTFTTYYKNILGIKRVAYTVDIDVEYIADGFDGYIINMVGAYNIENNNFYLNWDTNHFENQPYYHAMALDISYKSDSFAQAYTTNYIPQNNTILLGYTTLNF